MAKIGTAHIEVKPVLNESALRAITERIAGAVAEGLTPKPLRDVLLAYSEWLDSEGLIVGDNGPDKRTHDDLAGQFVGQWTGPPLT